MRFYVIGTSDNEGHGEWQSCAPVDHDGAGLAETVRASLRLQVHVRIPARHDKALELAAYINIWPLQSNLLRTFAETIDETPPHTSQSQR